VTRRRANQEPPSARRLLVGFLTFAALLAVIVFVAITVVLVRVRSDAERDVDSQLQQRIEAELQQSAGLQAQLVQAEMASVSSATAFLQSDSHEAFLEPSPASAAEQARYTVLPSGSYGTTDGDKAKVSVLYSHATALGPQQRAKASYLAAVDAGLRTVVDSNPLIRQAYINTYDGLTRIFPGMDVSMLDQGLLPPDYNFFYMADADHNPGGHTTWTNAYVDPAGLGWIVSSIAPVVVNDRLEAVVGVDVPLGTFVRSILSHAQSAQGFSMMLDNDGVIVAMPRQAEVVLGVKNAETVDYDTIVASDQFKTDDFNVMKRPDTAQLAEAIRSKPSGVRAIEIGGVRMLAAWNTLEKPTWQVVTFVPQTVVQELHQPGERLKHATVITLWIIVGALFLLGVVLAFRARRYSLAFTQPLEAIDGVTDQIGAGVADLSLPPAPVAELQRTGQRLLEMGRTLNEANEHAALEAERLRQSEARYRTIFDNVGTPVVTVGVDDVVIDSNEAADSLFGRSMKGVDLGTTFPDADWRGPGHRTVELRSTTRGVLMFELGVGVTGVGDDRVLTITARDITAQDQARRLLESARETAERTARLKDEFLASMSHEIRTPLNGVVGVLSLLAEQDLSPQARADLAVARTSADDLLVLVNDVLDFAKIEAGQVAVVSGDVRIAELLEGVRQLYAPFAADQRDVLAFSIAPEVPEWVHIDATRVRQVLVNLVSNALKFTEGGEVRIRVDLDHGGLEHDDDTFTLRFEVTDTGMGIDPEVQHRLFTRFAQGDPLAVRRFPGTGLGLAIVKRLTELMGGGVGVHSAPGRGSTFWFTVRTSTAKAPTVAVGRTEPAPPLPDTSLRVLVAEDNDVNRYLLVSMLERLGHDVTAVVNGREAIELTQWQPFDLVLMDVQMPVTNGIDATLAIRALPGELGNVPILAVTANVLPEQAALYGEVGFTGYLPKPLTLDQLRTAIAGVRSSARTVMTVTGPSATPRFNITLIEEYRSVIGDAGARQMVDLFVESYAQRRDELGQAVAANDHALVQRTGHTIKGMAAAAGAAALSDIGMRLQHATEPEVPGLVAALDVEAAAVLADLPGQWGLGG
jgi:signal transduction histidine kinase/DNA-binding response OmpR family regulator